MLTRLETRCIDLGLPGPQGEGKCTLQEVGAGSRMHHMALLCRQHAACTSCDTLKVKGVQLLLLGLALSLCHRVGVAPAQPASCALLPPQPPAGSSLQSSQGALPPMTLCSHREMGRLASWQPESWNVSSNIFRSGP